jgi:hypothetical protein
MIYDVCYMKCDTDDDNGDADDDNDK